MTLRHNSVECPECQGFGEDAGSRECWQCNGTGRISIAEARPRWLMGWRREAVVWVAAVLLLAGAIVWILTRK